MSAPIQVVPGRTLLISRRCTQRQFLLRPDERVTQIYLYCLGEAATRFGITLYAWVAMSNHHHLLIRDNHGNYPAFLAHLHKMLAKAMNAYRDRCENFWSSAPPSAVYVVESFDALMKIVYVLANPVAEDLVDRISDWPGASSLGPNLTGRTLRVKRPRFFFREHGTMPKEVELRLERPAGFADLTDAAWRKVLEEELDKAERNARHARREAKRGILGRKGVLVTSPTAHPAQVEPRRQVRPCIACKNAERREIELGLLRAFRAAYRAALALWRGGMRDTVFPAGTYRMVWFGAALAPCPA